MGSSRGRAVVEGSIHRQRELHARRPGRIFVAGGTQLRPFSKEILTAAYKASLEVYKEAGEKSPAFKKIYESMVKFRGDQLLWFRVAEKGFDDFMHTIQTIK